MRDLSSLASRTMALLLLALLLPVMLAVSVVVWWDTRRSPLFLQRRVGLRDRDFFIYKFRTMNQCVDAGGRLLPDAQRLTRCGRLLRSSSLDELPQLWNIVRGEMAFVGPRPLLPSYLPRYTARQRRRHEVKPGITGWAQIHGRNSIVWEDKLELDVWYVEHRSFPLDCRIVVATVGRVLRRSGIGHRGEISMPEFLGMAKKPNRCAPEAPIEGQDNEHAPPKFPQRNGRYSGPAAEFARRQ